jgi:hypothetical protein
MESIRIDRTKLLTVKNYALKKGYSPQRIYQLEKEGQVKFVEIDGVKFVSLT